MNTRYSRSALLALGMGIAALLPAASATSGYANEWRFNVTLDGKPIGYHRFLLSDSGTQRELTSEARFNVRILFFTAYSYSHSAKEQWQGSCLQTVDARTDDNGKQKIVQGTQSDLHFVVTINQRTTSLTSCVKTFAYWNPAILDATQLLNPQTGEYVPVTITRGANETLTVRGVQMDAERYRLIGTPRIGGPLAINLWYSKQKEWLALESITEGRHLRYQMQ